VKRKSDFNKNNKNRCTVSCVISRLKIAITIFLFSLFFTHNLSYAEEFVSFANGSAEFQIKMPNFSLSKVNHAEIINNSIVFNVFNFKQLSEALDKAIGGEVIVVRSNLREKRYHYKQKHRYDEPVTILGLLGQDKAPYLENITWENLHNVTLSHFKVSNLWDTTVIKTIIYMP